MCPKCIAKKKRNYLGKKTLNKSMPKCSAQSQGPGSGPDSRDATLFRARSLLNEGTHQSADEKEGKYRTIQVEL